MLTYTPEQPNAGYGQLVVRVDDATAIPALADEIRRTLPPRFPNALLRVEAFDRLRADGVAGRAAVVDGAVSRLRPVVLAAGAMSTAPSATG